MFHDPIQLPALIELAVLVVVLVVVSVVRARRRSLRQRNGVDPSSHTS